MSTLLQELIAVQSDRWPDSPAVVWRRKSLTYAELEIRSTQLARGLRDLGCRRGDRVCVASLPGPDAIVAALAIYKADAIYVPLDVTSSPERLARVIQACEPHSVLTCAAIAPIIDQVVRLGGLPVTVPIGALSASPVIGEHFSTAFCLSDVRTQPSRPLPYRNRASNPAQILFKRTHDGTPVGVVLTHANIRRFVAWANEHFGVMPGDRHLLQDSLSSDLSTYAITGTLAAGATLYPVSADVAQMPGRLSAFVRESGLTLWLTSAQTMSAMAKLDAILPGDWPSVRHVVWQRREALAAADLRHWLSHVRHARFTALYGPVEATIATSYHTIPARGTDEQTLVPAGRPRTDVSLLVLNRDLGPAAAEQVGDVFIAGVGLSPGYWRDPERTRAAFVRPPHAADDSARMFRTGDLGVTDAKDAISITGTRDLVRPSVSGVEVGEVEAALASLGAVQAAAVVTAGSDVAGTAVLCCAYVPVQGIDVRPADLRADLSLLVPPHMLPTRWKALDRLPCGADGAVGRDQIRGWFDDEVARG